MTKEVNITEELGELIADLREGEKVVVDELGFTLWLKDKVRGYDDHRWARTDLFVLQHGDDEEDLWGLLYDFGSTEDQESGFVYSTPVLYPVQAKQIITYKIS